MGSRIISEHLPSTHSKITGFAYGPEAIANSPIADSKLS